MHAHAQWLHDLRNVVNTAGVTVALAKRMMDRDDPDGAKEMLAMAEQAWERCRDMLSEPARTPGDAPGAVLRRRAEGVRPRSEAQPRR